MYGEASIRQNPFMRRIDEAAYMIQGLILFSGCWPGLWVTVCRFGNCPSQTRAAFIQQSMEQASDPVTVEGRVTDQSHPKYLHRTKPGFASEHEEVQIPTWYKIGCR